MSGMWLYRLLMIATTSCQLICCDKILACNFKIMSCLRGGANSITNLSCCFSHRHVMHLCSDQSQMAHIMLIEMPTKSILIITHILIMYM